MEPSSDTLKFEPCDDHSIPKCPNGDALKVDSFPPCDDGKPLCEDGTEARPNPHHNHYKGFEPGSNQTSHDHEMSEDHEEDDFNPDGRAPKGIIAAFSGASFLLGMFTTCLLGRCKRTRKCIYGSRNTVVAAPIIVEGGEPVTAATVTSSKFALVTDGVVTVVKPADVISSDKV